MRRRAERRVGVERPAAVGRDLVEVVARLVLRRHPLRLALAVERGCGTGRAASAFSGDARVVDPARRRIHAHARTARRRRWPGLCRSNAPGCHEPLLGPVARDDVEVPPAVALADPGEALAAVDPAQVVHHVHPGAVALGEHRARPPGRARRPASPRACSAARFRCWSTTSLGARRPLQPRDVVVARIAGDVEPDGSAAVGAHHADARRGVGRAGLGVLHRDDEGVERVGVVDQEKSRTPEASSCQ